MCVEGVWRVCKKCSKSVQSFAQKNVQKMFKGFQKSVLMFFGGCSKGVHNVFRSCANRFFQKCSTRCSEGVLSKKCQKGVQKMFRTLSKDVHVQKVFNVCSEKGNMIGG